MTEYNRRQIEAVRELQQLLEVPGTLTDDACREYLQWHQTHMTARARGINSVTEARMHGIVHGSEAISARVAKLRELAQPTVEPQPDPS